MQIRANKGREFIANCDNTEPKGLRSPLFLGRGGRIAVARISLKFSLY